MTADLRDHGHVDADYCPTCRVRLIFMYARDGRTAILKCPNCPYYREAYVPVED